jgi:hypothetical protein
LFNEYVDNLVNFINVIANDNTIDIEVFKNTVTVIGDLANVYGKKVKDLLKQQTIIKLVKEACMSQDPDVKEQGIYAKEQLEKLNY